LELERGVHQKRNQTQTRKIEKRWKGKFPQGERKVKGKKNITQLRHKKKGSTALTARRVIYSRELKPLREKWGTKRKVGNPIF